MIEYLKRRLSPEAYLQAYLPQITETFIEYYGEENRKNIEKKFQNILLICTQTPHGLKRNLFSLKKDYSAQLIKTFLDTMGLDYNEENVKTIFGDNEPVLDHLDSLPIEKYLKIFRDEDMSIYLKNSFLKDIKPFITLFYPSVEDVEDYIKNGDLTKLNKACDIYHNFFNEYNSFKKMMESYNNYINECSKTKKALKEKYSLKLVQKFQEYFTDEEIKKFKENNRPSGKILLYLGYNLDVPSIIEAFSAESEAIIDNSKSLKWQVDSIINDRIKFFQEMGIDLGSEYQNYQNDSKCQAIIPSSDLIREIRDTKEYLEMVMYNEYFTLISEYKKMRNQIDSLKLYFKDDGYNAGTFMYGSTYVTPNVRQENGSFIPFSLVNINFDIVDDFIDKRIIHELNHVYELELLDINENGASYTCGWEEFYEPCSSEEGLWPLYEDQSKRKYELFNEIINELIAQEIAQKMWENNIYIFNDPNHAKIKGGTGYEDTTFLVQTFYKQFKKEILASRHGNMNYLFDVCGEENFNQLNELFHLFKDKWSGLKVKQLHEDLQNKIDNENTQAFYEIVEKRDKILNNMIEYKKLKEWRR